MENCHNTNNYRSNVQSLWVFPEPLPASVFSITTNLLSPVRAPVRSGFTVRTARRVKALASCCFFIVTMEAFNYDGARWHRLRDKVMRRDGYQCQLSKRYGKIRQADLVHHIFPVADYPQYAYCAWNLISLSRDMHNKLHNRETDALTAMGIDLMRRTARKQGILL